MPPDTAPKVATMTWEQFSEAKKRRQRDSRYAPFILGMKIRIVYDATGSFPKVNSETLRTGLYGQARKLDRKITIMLQPDGKVLAALVEAPPNTGKEK